MRLKLTLQRGGQRPTDLLVNVDPTATVGDLAGYIARSDPNQRSGGSSHTFAFGGPAGRQIPVSTAVASAGIRSGAVVDLVEVVDGGGPSARAVAAVVTVLSGPDTGREFQIPAGTAVIGRSRECEVALSDPMVSRQHARLAVADSVEIIDLGSANGMLVGGAPAERAVLRPGDTVTVGDTVLAIRFVAATGHGTDSSAVPFNRPPNVVAFYEGQEFATPEPPARPQLSRMAIFPMFAPLLIGVVVYLSTKSTTSLIFMAMSPLMMVATTFEQRFFGKRNYRAALELFRADITSLVADMAAAQVEEGDRRRAEHPSAADCMRAIDSLGSMLWWRWVDLPGFGELRLGLGRQKSRQSVEVQKGHQNDRALWKELTDAVAPFSTIDNVPVVASMVEKGAIGVAGPRARALDAARGLIVQATALHSPADLSIAVLAPSEAAPDWEWIKWLPHCLAPQSRLSADPLASTPGGCVELVASLEEVFYAFEDQPPRHDDPPVTPRVLVIVEDGAPVDVSRLAAIAADGPAVGINVLWVAPDRARLPAACRVVLEVSGHDGQDTAGFVHTGDQILPLAVEAVSLEAAESVARKLSPVVDISAGDDAQSDLPRSVSLLDLTGRELADSPAAVVERWVENRSILTGPSAVPPTGSRRPGNLRAVVGASAAGPHVLDLRTHGPHALVGGTTGSGKSELLQSWIIGMALSNSPQRLTFLLVDYKGGSAFADCVQLPHTVGLVTDLSPHLVRRALTSLSAELRYREDVLHRKAAKDLATLEREGDPEAPPSLVIVVDEFAALVQEVPEFVDGVVNVAQRGRSLGLHLVLATQRPSGVIKDNLRANTNLRLALRMADSSDSSDVIGTNDAADFDPSLPGRAVSRSGPKQLVPFQSAYVGGWTSDAPRAPSIEVVTFGLGASTVWEPPTDLNEPEPVEGPTDIRRIVSNVSAAAQRAEIPPPRRPWLPELASAYDLARLPTRRLDTALVFAVCDEPTRQAQETVSFNPDVDGNLAVFGTGNAGKSTLLRSIAIAAGYTVRGGPCQVYGLDFGSRSLQMLEQLPHVGAIINGSDTERVRRLMDRLRDLIDERAARYAAVDAGTVTDYRRLSGQPDEPRIILLVDGMAAFRNAFETGDNVKVYETFLSIAADGRAVGVHVVLSADRLAALHTALASQIQRRVVMRLAEPTDYAAMGVPADVIDTKSPPGRGLLDEREIQVAVLGGSTDVLAQASAVRELAGVLRKAGVAEAPPVQSLGTEIDISSLPVSEKGPVIGVSGITLEPIVMPAAGTFVVTGPPGSGRSTAMVTIATAVRRWNRDARIFCFGASRTGLAARPGWERAAIGETDAQALAQHVIEVMSQASRPAPRRRPVPIVIMIEDLTDLAATPADMDLQAMVKQAVADGHLVVTEAETSVMSGMGGLLNLVRGGRTGVLLQPDQLDGSILKTQFPRLRKADFPPGRGLVVWRGSRTEVIQMAMGGQLTG